MRPPSVALALVGVTLLLSHAPIRALASQPPAPLVGVGARPDTSVLRRAQGFYRDEQYREVISLLAPDLELPGLPRRAKISLLEMLARCYARLGRAEELDATVSQLLKLSPSYRPDEDRIPPQECGSIEAARGRVGDRMARRVRIGVIVGASWSRFGGNGADGIEQSAARLGASFTNQRLRAFTGGVVFDVPLQRTIALQPQVVMLRRGGAFETTSALGETYREEYRLDCVDMALPVAVIALPRRRVGPLILAGPIASVRIGGRGVVSGAAGQSEGNLDDLSGRLTWGFVVGGGLWARNILGTGWQITGEYRHELSDVFTSSSLRSGVRVSGYALRLACFTDLRRTP